MGRAIPGPHADRYTPRITLNLSLGLLSGGESIPTTFVVLPVAVHGLPQVEQKRKKTRLGTKKDCSPGQLVVPEVGRGLCTDVWCPKP